MNVCEARNNNFYKTPNRKLDAFPDAKEKIIHRKWKVVKILIWNFKYL